MIFILIFIVIIAVIYVLFFYQTKSSADMCKKITDYIDKGYNVFVTGGAGTGKSYILNKLKKKYGSILNLTSTTGVSALNINGQTIHSWAGIGTANKPIEETVIKIQKNKNLYKQIIKAQMLAIDEISMLDNKTIDYINETLKRVCDNNKPFGGIQVLLFGDFFQLPPVMLGKNNIDFCFNSKTWQDLTLKPVILKEVKRQSEKEYINALNNIRLGSITAEDSKLFFEMEEQSLSKQTEGILHIFGTNQEADEYNDICFKKIETEPFTYFSKDTLYQYNSSGDATEIVINKESLQDLNIYEQKRFKSFNDDCKSPEKLTLKVGCRVMLLTNLDITSGLVNGSCGTVMELKTDSVRVKFDNGQNKNIEKAEIISYKDSLPKIKREQYPLRLAYGITIHKSQGMTFDELVVDLDKVFACGQAYVALSRTKSLEGLIIRNYAPGKISVNNEVVEFYASLEKNIPHKSSSSVKKNSSKAKGSNNINNTNNGTQNIQKTYNISNNYEEKIEIPDDRVVNREIIEDYVPENDKTETQNANIIPIIQNAINNNREIVIEYASSKEITIRTIIPQKLLSGRELNQRNNGHFHDKKMYLVAFCKLRNENRTFKLENIKSIVNVSESNNNTNLSNIKQAKSEFTGQINLQDCSEEDLISAGFDENKAHSFIIARDNGKKWYDMNSFAQDFELQPHEIVMFQDKINFHSKPQNKQGRKIDY